MNLRCTCSGGSMLRIRKNETPTSVVRCLGGSIVKLEDCYFPLSCLKDDMMRKTLLQSLAVMAIGAAIGYLAANGGFTASSGVQAATSDQPAIGGNKSAAIGSQRSEGCEINPAMLLAQAEPKKS